MPDQKPAERWHDLGETAELARQPLRQMGISTTAMNPELPRYSTMHCPE